MPWTYDDRNVITDVVIPFFGSQEKAAEALRTTGPTLMRRRRRPLPLSAEDAVYLEELTEGRLDRTVLRPDLWPRERWKKIRY